MRHNRGNRLMLLARIFALLIALVLLSSLSGVHKKSIVVYEKVSLLMWPNADRADIYGARHFDASASWMYDIGAAEYFYRELEKMDPNHRFVYHQLARIEFLKGRFIPAMAYIDNQIRNHGDSVPDSYYIRGLIGGYMGRYEDAVLDYAHYLDIDEYDSWAAINDYAWVLLKTERFEQASKVSEDGINKSLNNPWLLNTSAVAFYELGEYEKALDRAARALENAKEITEKEWLAAYPGNDPKVAKDGIETLISSAIVNMHRSKVAIEEREIQLQNKAP